jgi:hypothetical protein
VFLLHKYKKNHEKETIDRYLRRWPSRPQLFPQKQRMAHLQSRKTIQRSNRRCQTAKEEKTRAINGEEKKEKEKEKTKQTWFDASGPALIPPKNTIFVPTEAHAKELRASDSCAVDQERVE